MKVSRIFNVLMALFLIAAAMANVQPVAAQRSVASPASDISPDAVYVPGEVLVTLDGEASALGAQASALAGQVNAQVVDMEGNLALLSFAEDANVEELSSQLAASAGVLSATPNYIGWIPEAKGFTTSSAGHAAIAKTQVYRTSPSGQRITVSKTELSSMRSIRSGVRGTPTYPLEDIVADDWGWWETNSSIIWANTAVSPAVCVIDTGVDFLNPDLVGKMLAQRDFVSDDLIANDDNGHGTHVAGIIAGSNSNKKGIIGVSNSKIVAVRALTAQGWGTTLDLIEAINFCAANVSVKVINLSLGGFPAAGSLYDALNNAIVTKGKFVVAAAGNDSSSVYTFPAAWAADFVCANGTTSAACPTNLMDQGMVSVGAGYEWGNGYYDVGGFDASQLNPTGDDDGAFWVDKNNDGVLDSGENFDPTGCLTDFSNYGAWVQMIAPGNAIYSTLPISYPFTDIANDEGDGLIDGLGYMSGTSMAAPFVSGAAARVLSVNLGMLPAALKTKLMTTGRAMDANNLGADAGVLVGDITAGYFATQDVFPLSAGTGYTGEIPYCVPEVNGQYLAAQDMSAARYLDTAAAMGRTSLSVFVKDANTGLPLAGALVQAVQGAVIKDSATVGKYSSMVDLINIPTTYAVAVPPITLTTIKVSKALYATGFATVATYDTSAGDPYYSYNEFMNLSIPPVTTRMTLVVDWDHENIGAGADLDLFTYVPQVFAGSGKALGNPSYSGLFFNPGVEAGALYSIVSVPASVTPNFKTRWNFDGGNGAPSVESVTMILAGTAPFHNTVGSSNKYDFFLNDYGAGASDMATDTGKIVVRLWRAGLPVVGVGNMTPGPLALGMPYAYSLFNEYSTTCDSNGIDGLTGSAANNADNDWLHIAHIGGSPTTLSTFTIDDACAMGDPTGVSGGNAGGGLPYSVNGGSNK